MQLLKDRKQRQRLKQIKTIKTKIIESIFLFVFFLSTYAQIAHLYPTFEFMLMTPKTVHTF